MPLNIMSATLTYHNLRDKQGTTSFYLFLLHGWAVPVPSFPLSLVIGDGRVWRYSQRLYAPIVLSNDVTVHSLTD